MNVESLTMYKPWSELSISEKSQMMRVAVRNGITNLNDIKAKYNEFAEGGPKSKISDSQYYDIMEKVAEENYKKWGDRNSDEALLRILNANDYDYRGYYDEFPNGDGNALDHWPDKYKTAYHHLFSNESIYNGKRSEYNPEGIIGGFWYKDNLIKSPEQIRWQSSIGLDKAFGGHVVQMANKFDGTTQ